VRLLQCARHELTALGTCHLVHTACSVILRPNNPKTLGIAGDACLVDSRL